MHEVAQHAGDRDDADRIARVAVRFADESLGMGLTLDRITQAGTEGLRRARDAGPNTGATLDAAVEREIRRSIPMAHQGLIGLFAGRHRARAAAVGLDFEDLFGQGQIALIRAAEIYTPELGFRFTTYAGACVHRAMIRAIRQEPNPVAIPEHAWTLMAKDDKGRTLTRRQAEQARHARETLARPVIREVPGKSGESRESWSRLDRIIPDYRPRGLATVHDDLVPMLLGSLTHEERAMVESYYGIGRERRLFREIGDSTGYTRQRVHQKLRAVLVKLEKEIERRGLSCADCLAS